MLQMFVQFGTVSTPGVVGALDALIEQGANLVDTCAECRLYPTVHIVRPDTQTVESWLVWDENEARAKRYALQPSLD